MPVICSAQKVYHDAAEGRLEQVSNDHKSSKEAIFGLVTNSEENVPLQRYFRNIPTFAFGGYMKEQHSHLSRYHHLLLRSVASLTVQQDGTDQP